MWQSLGMLVLARRLRCWERMERASAYDPTLAKAGWGG